MTLVQRTRFATILKNLVGFRGPVSFNLDEAVVPTFDTGGVDGLLDDEVAYWIAPTVTAAPVAAQFSGVQVAFQTTVPLGTRMTVDGFIIRPAAAVTAYNFGITGPPAAYSSQVACGIRNNYLGRRGNVFGNANNINAILQGTYQQAATLFAAPAIGMTVDLPGGNTDFQPTLASLFPFVLQPGWCFTIESGPVNQQVAAGLWGRFLADQA